jgi:tetratricopeptide (TPR) repeat protein
MVCAASKEMKMKRNISLWVGLLAFALLPAFSQAPMGKVHGHVTNPSGAPEKAGAITFVGTDRAASGPGMKAMTSDRGVFKLDADGNFSGEVPPGIYKVVFRTPDMSNDKEADHLDNIQVVAGKDNLVDDDMSRKEYIDNLPADVRKSLDDLRKKNAEAMKNNAVAKNINADIATVNQDNKEADGAQTAAIQSLGAGATVPAIEAKATEIKAAKYAEVESLMLKDSAAKPDAAVLWVLLGQAQVSMATLKNDTQKYAEAETNLKKALEVDAASKKPIPSNQGIAYSGLGEIYARTGKVQEASDAYDAAAKAFPAGAAVYYKNEAVIFSNLNNGDATVAAANKAIAIDPTMALAYYLKGQGLIQKATIDPASGKMILPPGCAEAYQKYLDLDPKGTFINDVKGILAEATQTHNTAFGPDKSKKKK